MTLETKSIREAACGHGIRSTALAVAAGMLAAPVWAGSAKIGEDISVDYVLTVNYGLAKRVEKQAPELIDGPISPEIGRASCRERV